MVGKNIARYLADEGNDVTIIDIDGALVKQFTDQYDMKGVVGFASYPDVLEAAGAKDADMIIAATYSDEVNMVVCQISHSVFNITDKIARLRSESYTNAIYADMYRRDHLPVDVVISPEKAVAKAVARRFKRSASFDHETFLEGEAVFMGIRIDENCPLVHTPLKQITELFSTFRGKVVGVRREGKLFVPEAEEQLFEHDEVYLCVHQDDEPRAYEIFGKVNQNSRNLVIIGGGEVGLGIAQILEKEGHSRIKVIENDRARAEYLADTLDKATVFHGDGLDTRLLTEVNVKRADTVLCVTNDDKINLLSGARVKSLGVRHAISLVNDTALDDLAHPLAIDSIINPRTITISNILQHIRHGRIHAVYIVGENDAEVMEAQVLATSQLNGKRLSEIEWPDGAIVGAIRKGEDIVFPTPDTRLDDGDWVVVFALRGEISAVEQLFQVTIDFF